MLDDEPQEPGGPVEFQTAHHSGVLPARMRVPSTGGMFPGKVLVGGVQCLHIGKAERLATEPDGKPVIADPEGGR